MILPSAAISIGLVFIIASHPILPLFRYVLSNLSLPLCFSLSIPMLRLVFSSIPLPRLSYRLLDVFRRPIFFLIFELYD